MYKMISLFLTFRIEKCPGDNIINKIIETNFVIDQVILFMLTTLLQSLFVHY
jgi:hypothetical protein